jgi:hypothetical protein
VRELVDIQRRNRHGDELGRQQVTRERDGCAGGDCLWLPPLPSRRAPFRGCPARAERRGSGARSARSRPQRSGAPGTWQGPRSTSGSPAAGARQGSASPRCAAVPCRWLELAV